MGGFTGNFDDQEGWQVRIDIFQLQTNLAVAYTVKQRKKAAWQRNSLLNNIILCKQHRYRHCEDIHDKDMIDDPGSMTLHLIQINFSMMTSSNGNIFRVTGPLCRGFPSHRWIPLTKASDAELWYFLWSAPRITGWVNNRVTGDLRRHRAHST